MITAFLWALMQRIVVIPYRGCETTFKGQEFKKGRVAFHLRFTVRGIKLPTLGLLNLEIAPTGCPEKSLKNYNYSLRNCPEERSSRILTYF